MTNLLQETLQELLDHDLTPMDVLWVGSPDGDFGSSWRDFATIADVEYDNGFGAAKVAMDLVVVLRNGAWLERGDYDGSEWWEYREVPELRASRRPLPGNLTDGMWESVSDLAEKEEGE